MKKVTKYFVDNKEVTKDEYVKKLDESEKHQFLIKHEDAPETNEERIEALEEEVSELKKKVLELEILVNSKITITSEPSPVPTQPFKWPDYPWTTPNVPWGPNIVYCTVEEKTGATKYNFNKNDRNFSATC